MASANPNCNSIITDAILPVGDEVVRSFDATKPVDEKKPETLKEKIEQAQEEKKVIMEQRKDIKEDEKKEKEEKKEKAKVGAPLDDEHADPTKPIAVLESLLHLAFTI